MDQRWWLAAGLFVACASEPSAISLLGDGCLLDSDCEGALICVHRVCHDICGENRDCPDGQRCVRGGPAGNVCQQPEMALCVRNSDCPEGQACAVDGECRDECREDVDCVTGHVCVSGTCATEDELVDGELPSNGTLSEGAPCTLNSQCPADQTCVEGKCLFECINDVDCPSQQCIDNYCRPAGSEDCVFGEQRACTCASLSPGAQVCSDDGTWNECRCPPMTTTGMGGMSTVSGMGGMSTVSGMGGLGMGGLGMGGIMTPVTSSSGTGGSGGTTATTTSSSSGSTGGGGMMTTVTSSSSASTGGSGGMMTTVTSSTSGSGGVGGLNVAGAEPM